MYKVKITKRGKRFKTSKHSRIKETAADTYYQACKDHPVEEGYQVELIHHETGEVLASSPAGWKVENPPLKGKVYIAGCARVQGWLYYLDKNCNITRSRMLRGGQRRVKGDKPEIIFRTSIEREDGFLYFIDRQGDVSRSRMSRGGVGARKKRYRRNPKKKAKKKALFKKKAKKKAITKGKK